MECVIWKRIKKRIVLIVIGVILLVVLTILGVKYYLNNYIVNDAIEEVPTEEDSNNLTQEELAEYLNYIPFGMINTETVPYYNRSITVDEVDKTLLVNTALNGNYEFVECSGDNPCLPKEISAKHFGPYGVCEHQTCTSQGYDFYPLDKVNTSLKKMFNIDFNTLNIKKNTIWEYIDERIMYFDNGFLSKKTTLYPAHVIHTIEKYEFNGEELIIYDYPLKGFSNYWNDDGPLDFQNGNYVNYQIIDPQKEAQSESARDAKISNYVSQHKEDFTLFKYTFKKNNDNYYWYSSEVLSEPRKENTFTEYELQEYLNYVPYINYKSSAQPYYVTYIDVNTIDNKLLINMALSSNDMEYIYCEDEKDCLENTPVPEEYRSYFLMDDHKGSRRYDFYPVEKVSANIKKNYNKNFYDMNIKDADTWIVGSNAVMYYQEGFIKWDCCGGFAGFKHAIDKYEVVNDELIIYEKVLRYLGYDNYENPLTKEMTNDINKAPLYKTVFKQNDTGYYWYSTEVVAK